MVLIFPNLCLWRRSLRSNVGGIDPEKLYRATLKESWSLLSSLIALRTASALSGIEYLHYSQLMLFFLEHAFVRLFGAELLFCFNYYTNI